MPPRKTGNRGRSATACSCATAPRRRRKVSSFAAASPPSGPPGDELHGQGEAADHADQHRRMRPSAQAPQVARLAADQNARQRRQRSAPVAAVVLDDRGRIVDPGEVDVGFEQALATLEQATGKRWHGGATRRRARYQAVHQECASGHGRRDRNVGAGILRAAGMAINATPVEAVFHPGRQCGREAAGPHRLPWRSRRSSCDRRMACPLSLALRPAPRPRTAVRPARLGAGARCSTSS